MNYLHHAVIGTGTACLGVMAAEALGMPKASPADLGICAVLVVAGSIATDLDHPRSFVSNSLPTRVIRIGLVILMLPLLAGAATFLTTPDLAMTWKHLSGMLLGISVLRWSLMGAGVALGLIGLSWILYRSLHHRGPLHSFFFTFMVSLTACLVFAIYQKPWWYGLAFGWGWLWHILADGLTNQGVPFGWPFNDHRGHSLPVWACGIGRILISAASIIGIVVLAYTRLRPLLG
jgi:membrane-bound metal-dependent hydrolase YbcI (DUF457 family)